jgi:hypothetical protein
LFIVEDVERLDFRCFCASASNSMLLETHVGSDLRHRNCGRQVSHAHQIVGGAGQGKYPVHFAHPAMSNLPHERYRLQPAEAFFDPFPLLLAGGSWSIGAFLFYATASSSADLMRSEHSAQINPPEFLSSAR